MALVALALPAAIAIILLAEVRWTRPVRASVATYSELIQAANMQDLPRLRRLCSARYLRTHRLVPAREGGVVGLPRNIHKNFQAWREGPNVWLCPSNRVGPLYQFVLEDDAWKFDGPIGLLRPRGEVVRMPEDLNLDAPPARP